MPLYTTVRAYRARPNGSLIVVIPKEIREDLGIEEGSELKVWRNSKGHVIYERVKTRSRSHI